MGGQHERRSRATGPRRQHAHAATYYDPNQLRLNLKFNAAYTGDLRLYAVDWDSTTRREMISVAGQTATLGEFNQGAWVSFPISVAAGETVPTSSIEPRARTQFCLDSSSAKGKPSDPDSHPRS